MPVRYRGFTLVELLIVMAAIGVLAAIVLVAINPVEQLNRAKDAQAITNANQLYNAALRAYTAQGTLVTPDNSYGAQQPLVNAGELKAILKDSSGGPYYRTSANASWISPGDFEVNTGWLSSQKSLDAAKTQSDAYAQNCGSGSTQAQYYAYLSKGGTWHYWCNQR